MNVDIFKYVLNFKQPSGTSRGVLNNKETWFIKLSDGKRIGWGEIGMFKGLSYDDRSDFEKKLKEIKAQINSIEQAKTWCASIVEWPSIRFGLEQAVRSFLSQNPFLLFDTNFVKGSRAIPINGLVWMGDIGFMQKQVQEKINQGFKCIKIKIGALDFNKELELLQAIRKKYSEQEIELRVDANGAFSKDEALSKLNQLAKLKIHSIEQPLKQGQIVDTAEICRLTPIPIALDEELIGVNYYSEKVKLLEKIKPNYIILKPTLVGGFESCDEWIEIASSKGIDWWITSALESNIGLNAIAQYVSSKHTSHYQGLGTGGLFLNNISSPLNVIDGKLHYNKNKKWDITLLSNA